MNNMETYDSSIIEDWLYYTDLAGRALLCPPVTPFLAGARMYNASFFYDLLFRIRKGEAAATVSPFCCSDIPRRLSAIIIARPGMPSKRYPYLVYHRRTLCKHAIFTENGTRNMDLMTCFGS